MKRNTYFFLAALLPGLLLGPLGCETIANNPRTSAGAGIGTAAGALAGGIIGHQSGNTATGAIIGGLTGAVLGGGIGQYMDRQARRFQQIQDVQVEKLPPRAEPDPYTGRPLPERLVLRMSNEVLFERGSSALSPRGTEKMSEIARILQDYPDSVMTVKGYASAEGSDADNTALSQRRADAVKNTLVSYGVDPRRIRTMGLGESNPIADNSTLAGRAQNRRVEIEVVPIGQAQGSTPPRDDRYAPPPADDRYAPPPADDRYAPPPVDDRYREPAY